MSTSLRHRPMLTLASAVLALSVVSGCSLGVTPGESGDASGDTTSTASSDATSGSGDDVVDEGTAGTVDLADLGDPAATAMVPATVEGDPAATMEVAVYPLQRRGQTVVATFSFRVESTTEEEEHSRLYDYLGSQFWNPYAVDTTNLTKHDVVADGGSSAMTSDTSTRFQPGQTFYAHAVFAAPPEDVTTMDVAMVDGAPMATAVPIR